VIVNIDDADQFFDRLQGAVAAIEESRRPHPLSTELAVATLKRYLSDPVHRIRLADLISEAVDRALAAIAAPGFGGFRPEAAHGENMTALVRSYDAATETVAALAAVGGRWAELDHAPLWMRVIERLAAKTRDSGLSWLIDLQRYPACRILWALGLGAVEGERIEFLGRVLRTQLDRGQHSEESAAGALAPFMLLSQGPEAGRQLEGMNRRQAPLNDWLYSSLRPLLQTLLPDDARFQFNFVTLEVLAALATRTPSLAVDQGSWFPAGTYGYRTDACDAVLAELVRSLTEQGSAAPLVRARVCGSTAEECRAGIESFRGYVARLNQRWQWS